MAKLHHLVLLAQRLAEGRRLHPSNAAFGQWVKDNGFDHLTHRDRTALLRIAQLDPQEASHHINRSSYTTPEHLWYRVLRHLAVRKTEPEPEVEVYSTEQIKEFLKRLETRQPGSYQFIYEEVLPFALSLTWSSNDPINVFRFWLERLVYLDLDGDDRHTLVELVFKSRHSSWVEYLERRLRKTPRRSGR